MKRRLYSWLDVDFILQQRRASSQWPDWLIGGSAYVDGLEMRVRQGTAPEKLSRLLGDWFGANYNRERGLELESPEGTPRFFAIQVEEAYDGDQLTLPLAIQPTFRRVSLFSTPLAQGSWPDPFPSDSPVVTSFYSFKGGVGRTTHLLAYAAGLAARRPTLKALIIDADLEAPGLTSLAQKEKSSNLPDFSFVDFLALAHGDSDPTAGMAIALASQFIKPQTIPVSIGSTYSEHYFLPAFRDPSQALSLDLRPEHLISSRRDYWRLGDLLARLGRELRVDAVLIDLRAGISELASPMLFDPRMHRFIVTTPSSQSSDGTLLILSEVAKIAPPAEREDLFDPAIIVSFVTPEFSEGGSLADLDTALLSRYPDTPTGVDLSSLTVTHTGFAQELLYLDSLSDSFRKLSGTNVAKVMSDLADEVVPNTRAESRISSELDLRDLRTRISALARDLEYAESGRSEGFLRIAPIRNLGKQFATVPPVAVIVGPKGAGKTYICLQIVRSKFWSQFASVATAQPITRDWGLLWPVFQSKNLKQSAKAIVDQCKGSTAAALRLETTMSTLEVEDAVQESLRHQAADETWWRHRWFRLFAESLGIKVGAENEGASLLISRLKQQSSTLVIVIDGLEDLFPAAVDSQIQQVALRALLQGVPNYLREVPNCPLGISIFVRADLAQSAIPQNFGQFLRLYDSFALRWSEEEALRLAVWIADEAGMGLAAKAGKAAEIMSAEEAKGALLAVWGRKLGRDNSREARSAEWVIAALSDLRGQIQARDLVRFFRYAAADDRVSTFADRVLAPRAIRDAIQPCSTEKIEEIKQEIPVLKRIFTRLQESTDRRIPFDAASSGLSVGEIRFLEAVGVVTEDRGEYFMPEIFRLGLGFQLAQGARPRVLSLARRVVR